LISKGFDVGVGDSKSPVERRVGSSPTAGTILPLFLRGYNKDKPTIKVGFFVSEI